MGWVALATVLLKIVQHFIESKTPEAKKKYVERVQSMSEALVGGNIDRVNELYFELRDEARQGDTFGLGVEAATRRQLPGDPGMDR